MMSNVKTYGWLSPGQLKAINNNPEIMSLLYDLSLLPEEISARVRAYIEEERERCAKIAEAHRGGGLGIAGVIAKEIRGT
jgi:hypothetical protein